MDGFFSKFLNTTIIYYSVIIILPLLIFWRAAIGESVIALGDLSGSDLLELHLPFKYILKHSYSGAELPLWSPGLSTGFPILAEGQSGPLYPVNVLLTLFSPYFALNYSIFITLIIAGTGMYTFARFGLKIPSYGSFVSGVVFMLCSFFIARMKHLNMITVAAYLPWGLYLIHKYCATLNFKWYLLLSVVIVLQIFAGHPQLLFFCILLYGWQLAGEIGAFGLNKGSRYCDYSTLFYAIKVSIIFCVSVMIAIGVGSVQLIPSIELSSLSNRTAFNFDTATAFPMPPKFLASLITPFFLGNPAQGTYKVNIRTEGIWWENVLYIGVLPIIVTSIYIFYLLKLLLQSKFSIIKTSSTRYWQVFYLISILFFLLISLGNYSFFFKLVYDNIPGMNLFRFPMRFNLYTLFALALFAGWSMDKLVRMLEFNRIEGKYKRNTGGDFVFSWPFNTNMTKVITMTLITVELTFFINQYVGFFPANKFLYRPETLNLLTESGRIYPMTQYQENPYGVLGWKKGEDAIFSLQKALPGNFTVVYGLASFTDRGWFEGGLGVKERNNIESILLNQNIDAEIFVKILSIWNVRYVIGYSEMPDKFFQLIKEFDLDKVFGSKLYLHKLEEIQPEAYWASNVYFEENNERALNRIVSNDFKKSDIVIASKGKDFSRIEGNNIDSAKILEYKPTSVKVYAKNNSERFLVLSDLYYPGWNAYIDGIKSPVYRVNLISRAVKIGAGEHIVIWRYEPLSFYIGAGISIASVISVMSYLLINYLKKGRAGRGNKSEDMIT